MCEESCDDCVPSSRTDPLVWMEAAALAAAWGQTPPGPGPALNSAMELSLQEEKSKHQSDKVQRDKTQRPYSDDISVCFKGFCSILWLKEK